MVRVCVCVRVRVRVCVWAAVSAVFSLAGPARLSCCCHIVIVLTSKLNKRQ